eukprot:7022515-Pyramimonas_sp.AAC.1
MLKVKASEFEDLIGQRLPDLDDEDDAWVMEPEDPFPQKAGGGQPAAAETQATEAPTTSEPAGAAETKEEDTKSEDK